MSIMSNGPIELNHYYHDRGIKKYLGFYLSEHTRELHQRDKEQSLVNEGKDMMTFDDIFEIINTAIMKQTSVVIQPNVANSDDGGFFDEIKGKINGFTETTIYIDDLPIELSLIRHIELTSDAKWYQVADVDEL